MVALRAREPLIMSNNRIDQIKPMKENKVEYIEKRISVWLQHRLDLGNVDGAGRTLTTALTAFD